MRSRERIKDLFAEILKREKEISPELLQCDCIERLDRGFEWMCKKSSICRGVQIVWQV